MNLNPVEKCPILKTNENPESLFLLGPDMLPFHKHVIIALPKIYITSLEGPDLPLFLSLLVKSLTALLIDIRHFKNILHS